MHNKSPSLGRRTDYSKKTPVYEYGSFFVVLA